MASSPAGQAVSSQLGNFAAFLCNHFCWEVQAGFHSITDLDSEGRKEIELWRGKKLWTLWTPVGYLKLLRSKEELSFQSSIK